MRIKDILKSKSGVSIIYVLATMSLFLALSVAVLSAASSSYSTVQDTTKDSQVRTIAMSISETFLSSLNASESEFGEAFVEYLYTAETADADEPVAPLTVEINFTGSNIVLPEGLEIGPPELASPELGYVELGFTFPGTDQSSIQITPDNPGTGAYTMVVMMTFTMDISYGDEIETYQATYQNGEISIQVDTNDIVTVSDPGTWEQIGFEQTSSTQQ